MVLTPAAHAIKVDNSVVKYFQNNHPEIVGKRARMKFDDGQGGDKWSEGVVSSYNVITGKYGVFFLVMEQQKKLHMMMEILDS